MKWITSSSRFEPRRGGGVGLRTVTVFSAASVACLLTSALLFRGVAGQESKDTSDPRDESLRLIEQEPWDELTLDSANNNAVLRIFPLPLKPRVVPKSPAPSAKLRIRLIDNPSQEYEVQWQYIVKLRLYEQMVLEEAIAMTAKGKSEAAWEDLEFLLERYPTLPGLDKARLDYLYAEAGKLFQQQRYDAALGVLEELYRLDNSYSAGGTRNLSTILTQLIDKLSAGYFAKHDFATTRRLLDRIEVKFGTAQKTVVAKWRDELERAAEEKSQEARDLMASDKYLEARAVSREVLSIWPKLAGARQLVTEIEGKYPLIVVGVTQQLGAGNGNPASFDNWAARRVGRLTTRRLVEFEGHRPDGGHYTTPIGQLELSDDRQRITFQVDPGVKTAPPLSSFELSRRLLDLGDRNRPKHDPLWAHLLATVEVDEIDRVQVELRQSHVLPHALLDLPLSPPPAGSAAANQNVSEPDGPYKLSSRTFGDVRFTPNPQFSANQGELDIMEHHFADIHVAAQALERGEIDVVDRLHPADVGRLRKHPDVVVQAYSLPTMCWLVPNPRNPFTASATFRRALLYGIDREGVLSNLQGAGKIDGCRIVSGPFPPGMTGTDSWAYAYDPDVPSRPYEPRLALTLVALAKRETQELAKKLGRPEPKLKPLTLVHPPEPLARAACETMVERLALIGVECKLKLLLPGQTADPTGDWDLMYMEAAMWEPFVDARRLLSLPAVDQLRGDYVRLAQMRLDLAQNESEGRRRLRELHLLMHHELTVIPLWQMVNHFAYRSSIKGIHESTLHLYDRAKDWRRVLEPVVAAK